MGKNDIYMKSYLSDKARFTDLFNCIVGQGEELFSVDGMRELNGAAGLVANEQEGKEHDPVFKKQIRFLLLLRWYFTTEV